MSDEKRPFEVGDRVFVSSGTGRYIAPYPDEITRTTKTQALIGGTRYNRKTGMRIGGPGWIEYPNATTERRFRLFLLRKAAQEAADRLDGLRPESKLQLAGVDRGIAAYQEMLKLCQDSGDFDARWS